MQIFLLCSFHLPWKDEHVMKMIGTFVRMSFFFRGVKTSRPPNVGISMSGRNRSGPHSLIKEFHGLPAIAEAGDLGLWSGIGDGFMNLQSVVLIVLDQNDHKGVRSRLVPSVGNRNLNSEPLPSSLSTQMLPPYRSAIKYDIL